MSDKRYLYHLINRGFSDWEFNRYIESIPDNWLRFIHGENAKAIIDEAKSIEIANMANIIHNNMNGKMDFIFGNHTINMIPNELPDRTLLCGPDIAAVLGYSQPNNMYRMLMPNEIVNINVTNLGIHQVNTQDSQHGGLRNMAYITIPGLFRVTMASNRPEAKEFQNYVLYVILPSIINNGYYASANTRDIINNNPMMAVEYNNRVAELEAQIFNDRPYTTLGYNMVNATRPLTCDEAAKLISKMLCAPLGRTRFFKWLREHGYCMKANQDNVPTQASINNGLMTYTVVVSKDGNEHSKTLITAKGLAHFVEEIRKEFGNNGL